MTMKKLLFSAMALALSASVFVGCSGNSAQNYTDPEEQINTKVNGQFIVELVSNPSTGFSWQAEYDTAVIELIEQTYEANKNTGEGIIGAGGVDLFKFKALSTGGTEITLKYKRAWETEVFETWVFTVNIK